MTSQVADIIPEVVNKFAIVELVEKFIRKKGSQFCGVSHSGKNLGCSPSRGGAEKRLAQVEAFKHMKKSSVGDDEVEIAKALDEGRLVISDDEIAKFVAEQNYLNAKSLFNATALRAKGQEVLGRYLTENELRNPDLVKAITGRLIVVGNEGSTPTVKDLRDWLMENKHLPGKHDQADHAGAKGAAGKVAHTPSQIRDAAARQYAKDEAVSIAEAKKKVTSGAHVPTTKIMQLRKEKEELEQKLAKLKKLRGEGVGTFLGGASKDFDEKSIVVKADQACLQKIWSEAYKYYTGKWIAAAQQFVLKKDWGRAAAAMAKARDGYQEEKNPKEWGCLDTWRQFYQDKVEGGK